MSLIRPKSKLASVALISALSVVPLGAGVAYVALPAYAQTAQPQTPPPPPPPGDKAAPAPGAQPGGPMQGPMHKGPMQGDQMHRGPMGMGPGHAGPGRMGPMADRFEHGHHGRGQNRQMKLASRLSAVETAIGVRSDQLDAWRDFTSKLIAFSTPDWRMHGGPADRAAPGEPPMKAGNAQGDATPPAAPAEKDVRKDFGPLAHLVDGAIRRGQQAEQLKAAMDKLTTVLTPQQIQMARALMRPEHGMRHGWHNWHHDHMWRHHGPEGGHGFDRPGPDHDQQ